MPQYRVEKNDDGGIVVYNSLKTISRGLPSEFNPVWNGNFLNLYQNGRLIIKERPFNELLDDAQNPHSSTQNAADFLTDKFQASDTGALLSRITSLENLRAIEIEQAVVLGQEIQVDLPTENPNIIGIVQLIDTSDSDNHYYPEFILENNGKRAKFISVITLNPAKIILWPRMSS